MPQRPGRPRSRKGPGEKSFADSPLLRSQTFVRTSRAQLDVRGELEGARESTRKLLVSEDYTGPVAPRSPLPRNPSGERMWPLKPETDFWGFPVYFSPAQDEAQREQHRCAAATAKLQHDRIVAETLARREADSRQRKAREDDYATFLLLSQRYGPLPGLLFSATDRPGLVYSQVIRGASGIVVRWGRDRIPAVRRWHAHRAASNFTKRSLRIGLGNVVESWEKERLAQRALHRHWNRYKLRVVRLWRNQVLRGQLLRFVRRRHRDQHWRALRDFLHDLHTGREVRVRGQRAIASRRNKRIVMAEWVAYTLRNRRIRAMWRDNALRTVHPYVRQWKHWIFERPHNAARAIQALVRDVQYRHYRGANLLQAVFRGHRVRRAVPELVQRWQEVWHGARLQHWRERLEPLLRAELERWNDEFESAADIVADAKAEVGALLASPIGQRQVAALAQQLYVDAKRHGRVMVMPAARLLAKRKLRRGAEAHARLLARRRFRAQRPPPFECFDPACARTFVVEFQIQRHHHGAKPDDPVTELAQAAQAQVDALEHARRERTKTRTAALRRQRRQLVAVRKWQDAVLELMRPENETLRARLAHERDVHAEPPPPRLKPGSIRFDQESTIVCQGCREQFAVFAELDDHLRGAAVCVRRVRRLAEERAARRDLAARTVVASLSTQAGQDDLRSEMAVVQHEFDVVGALSPRSQMQDRARIACSAVDFDGAGALTFPQFCEVCRDLDIPLRTMQLDEHFREIDVERLSVASIPKVVAWLGTQEQKRGVVGQLGRLFASGPVRSYAMHRLAAAEYRRVFPADKSANTSPRQFAREADVAAKRVHEAGFVASDS